MTGPVLYTEHPDHTVHATAAGNDHELVWHPDPDALTGDVTLDNQTRAMGVHLPPKAFHVQAETYFGIKHEPPAELLAWIARSKRVPT